MGTVGFRGKSVDILKGPFDPGGQPVLESPNQLLLGLFAWNLTAGATISKAVLKDPERCQNFWRWDTAQTLVREADALGLEFQIPFGRWLGHGGVTRFNPQDPDSSNHCGKCETFQRFHELFLPLPAPPRWVFCARPVAPASPPRRLARYARASSTMLNGVSAARRIRVKPPAPITSRSFFSPA